MKNWIMSVICCLALMGCSPSPEAIQKAISETQTAMPTPTNIPIKELHLDDILILEHDLPAGLTGSQITNNEDCQPGDICTDYYIKQDLAYENKTRGTIIVWVYENPDSNALRFEHVKMISENECSKTKGQCREGFPKSISGLGEKSIMIDEVNYIGPDNFFVFFTRCNATIEINWWAVTNDPDSISNYALRLDDRLKELVCNT